MQIAFAPDDFLKPNCYFFIQNEWKITDFWEILLFCKMKHILIYENEE